MNLAFDEVKATQAAALFLKLAGAPLNYMALIKLLYRADREAFRRFGLSVTTDKYVSMKFGPVTSNIYDRIKASLNPNVHPTFWSAHIQRTADPYTVALQVDPGNSELSRAEEQLIAEIFAADGQKGPFTLADECHNDFRNGTIQAKAPPPSIFPTSLPHSVCPRTKPPISNLRLISREPPSAWWRRPWPSTAAKRSFSP